MLQAKQRWATGALARGRARVPYGFGKHPATAQRRSFSALNYVEEMRSTWKQDPSAVHSSWQDFFSKQQNAESTAPVSAANADPDLVQKVASDHIRMLLLVRSYQVPTGLNFPLNCFNCHLR